MKKLFYTLAAICIALVVINSNTDWFSDFGDYFPQLEEGYPEAVSSVEEASDFVSELTDMIPTPSELIAILKNEELPIDPSDVAVNAYIENSPMLTFYPEENISAKIKDGEYIRLFGVSGDKNKKHFIVRFSDADNEELDQTSMSLNSDGEFDKTIKIPKSERKYMSVEVYAGSRAYGEFTSWVYNYLYLSRDENGAWSIRQSPVYAHNKKLYTADKAISDALKDTPAIESDEEEIIELAEQITEGAGSDYEKLCLIHDWVCGHIRYDTDRLNSTSTVPYAAVKVLENRSAVCLGFSTLTAALCRSVGIPCNVVSGYALGVGLDTEWTTETVNTSEQNHAWNEAYVDGRWVIMDTTWDCPNKIENGEIVTGEVSHIYFDANIDFFSANHKIIEYMKRP
ncbi:MAG: transglutaminase-like domain-containing protein [bacterium]|nr:transglutaminase-like domain-containing protein [bacterium]